MTDTTVVEMKEVTRIFPGSPPVNAVRSVDLRVNERDYVSIAGPSGSGKSTLLNLIGCLDRPTRGTYMLRGVDVGALTQMDGALGSEERRSALSFRFFICCRIAQ